MINKAYIHKMFNDTYIMTGVQFMPIQPSFDGEIMRLINMLGAGLFPISLCLLLPVFIYNIVLEKEQKLIEIMKMNGMKMKNYWMTNFLFNFIVYALTVFVFCLTGAVILGLSFFTQSNWAILILFFVGWGFAQISLSFFFSAFLQMAQTASIIGYLLSIWVTLVAVSLNLTLFGWPNPMVWYLHLYPTFSFVRFFYIFAYHCAFETCLSSFTAVGEAWICILSLYVQGIVYMIFALYLTEVIPQNYGVQQSWLFPIRML